ncbi:MAG: acyl carrier protein [Labilithrix sp.]|nr:acyl carrier protein [Labilithrix sp.]MCW5811287.1 acyl carrier protein [Labilithrix sp.]
MSEAETREKIRTMLLENFLKGAAPETLKDDVSLERAHIVDSVRTLELIMFIEETFGFTVENDDAVPENFDTVNAIVAYVERKKGS